MKNELASMQISDTRLHTLDMPVEPEECEKTVAACNGLALYFYLPKCEPDPLLRGYCQ